MQEKERSTEYAKQAMAAVAKNADVKRAGLSRFCVVMVSLGLTRHKISDGGRERASLQIKGGSHLR